MGKINNWKELDLPVRMVNLSAFQSLDHLNKVRDIRRSLFIGCVFIFFVTILSLYMSASLRTSSSELKKELELLHQQIDSLVASTPLSALREDRYLDKNRALLTLLDTISRLKPVDVVIVKLSLQHNSLLLVIRNNKSENVIIFAKKLKAYLMSSSHLINIHKLKIQVHKINTNTSMIENSESNLEYSF